MELNFKSTLTLNNEAKMPMLGLRVYKIKGGEDTYNTVLTALKIGYRLIDTARIYCNEKSVGRAIADSGIDRKDIFVTTKIWIEDFDNPRQALLDSLKRLNLDYVDLYLVHWPAKGYQKVYLELEKLQQEGLCKSIGVCNFKIHHIKSLFENGATVYPQVCETEIHPLNTEVELMGWCRQNKIAVCAYSPLGSEGRLILDDPRLICMRDYYKASASQIILRWCIQRGLIAVPKATSEEKLLQNSKLYDFDISTPDLETISDMNCNERRNYDPDKIDLRPKITYPKIVQEL